MEMNSKLYNTKDALKENIRDAMADMNGDEVTKTCSSFESWMEKAVIADGTHIEWFCNLYMSLTLYKVSLNYINLLYIITFVWIYLRHIIIQLKIRKLANIKLHIFSHGNTFVTINTTDYLHF